MGGRWTGPFGGIGGPSADLMAEVFPTVPLRRQVTGRETLLSIEHARRVLGYEPAHRLEDHVQAP